MTGRAAFGTAVAVGAIAAMLAGSVALAQDSGPMVLTPQSSQDTTAPAPQPQPRAAPKPAPAGDPALAPIQLFPGDAGPAAPARRPSTEGVEWPMPHLRPAGSQAAAPEPAAPGADTGAPALDATAAPPASDQAGNDQESPAPGISGAGTAGTGVSGTAGANTAALNEPPGTDLAYGAFQRGFYLSAFGLAIPRAEAGDKAAQTLLGLIYVGGYGVPRDPVQAVVWY